MLRSIGALVGGFAAMATLVMVGTMAVFVPGGLAEGMKVLDDSPLPAVRPPPPIWQRIW